MMKHRIFSNSILLLGSLSLGMLAGCGSGTTYGTGVSQESQLASDIGGVLLLGGDDKKEPIDYSSRPKLVKAPATAALPTPAESVSGDSAYFPTDPEVARAKRLAALEADDDKLGNRGLLPGTDAPKIVRAKSRKFVSGDESDSAEEYRRKSVEGKEARLARMNELRGTGQGVRKRKYLTQPPVEYRTPAETAESGKLGDFEKSAEQRKKTNIFGG